MDQRVELIENELASIRQFVSAERKLLDANPRSRSATFFLQAKEDQASELEGQLRRAKDLRRNELVELRLSGPRVGLGEIPLELLAQLAGSLEALLVASAHKILTGDEVSPKRIPEIRSLLNLRLSGIGRGSTRLFFVGDLVPDTTGESVLEAALKGAFSVLNSEPNHLADAVDTVGIRAAKSCKKFLSNLLNSDLQANFVWQSAARVFDWSADPLRSQDLRAQLNKLGDPSISERTFVGEVRNLSDTGRVEIRTAGQPRVRIKVPKEKYHLLQDLHLGQNIWATVNAYEWNALEGSRTVFHLKSVGSENQLPVRQALTS